MSPFRRPTPFVLGALLCFSALPVQAIAQALVPFVPDPHTPGLHLLPENYGGYSGDFLRGGLGLVKPLPEKEPLLEPAAAWTLSAWVHVTPGGPAAVAIGGLGLPSDEDARLFVLADGRFALRLGANPLLSSDVSPAINDKGEEGDWHFLAATYSDGAVRFFVDGKEAAHGTLHAGSVRPDLELAPVDAACGHLLCPHFGGKIALLTLHRGALAPAEIAQQAGHKPDFRLVTFEAGSKPWPIQTIQFAGNVAPQEPAMLPQPKAPFSKPDAAPPPPAKTMLQSAGDGNWTLSGGWKLAAAPDVHASAAAIASTGFDTQAWMPAIVPGTVLTSMIANGVYPDPDYGLNNLDIPELLNRQDYWYRAEFSAPTDSTDHHLRLVFDGINYQAEVWLNGQRLGEMKGAFIRGVFDVTGKVHSGGENVVAIRVSPPPYPGIPNEQSIALGAGLNGGAMALDGPTFMATEGWDWFPPMRDRDTGLWQGVRLLASGSVSLGDPQVVTHLPLPDITQADIDISVPLDNQLAQPVQGKLSASFEGVIVQKTVTLAPGDTTVSLTPAEFPQLHLAHPRLWWPNGYGQPNLYHLKLQFTADSTVSSEKTLDFGVREVSYELSLLDNHGDLRRLDYDPTLDRTAPQSAVDVTHAGMRQVPGGWASSVKAGEDDSAALRPVADAPDTPDLILKVNGVRIAVRGGSWGMDDTRKRIARDHLEPFFRMDRDANVNIIRNWQGQNTEPVFYELADKYGLMVWNDFWEVTQDSNAEAGDSALFLRNAQDTILRYRNHPSIVMWCGRNEGVPQPAINTGLIALTHSLDGTRYYSPSSNRVNLENSGPYSYEEPADYFTKLDRGFAVEVGTPSLPTLEWFQRWLPAVDRWPIDDDWGYHNWHPYGALNDAMQAQFGASDSLEDYVRKAQMMNYVDYRAIFEGFNQHLWAPNGGRLLWMTQPAWPSMLWGILSSDYDAQASFYATKKACEPLHVQLDPSDNQVAVIDTTRDPLPGALVRATVYSLDGKQLFHTEQTVSAAADNVTPAMHLDLAPFMGTGTVLVRLELLDAQGTVRSQNTYWRAASDAGFRTMDAMQLADVTLEARLLPKAAEDKADRTVEIRLRNSASVPALEAKLVLEQADGKQVLPAYYSDNYIALMPGEQRTVTIEVPPDQAKGSLHCKLRGWNITPRAAPIEEGPGL
jgi:hypothetical protein